MSQASGDDDTLASGGVAPADLASSETIASPDLASSETVVSTGGRLLSVPTPELPVVAFESYVRIDEYARGGLGRIIRAKDERTGRFVAIKEMLVDNDDAGARFVREALVTANLQHPAIVPVYEVGQWPDGKPFYAMKLVRGRPLNEVIAATANLDDRLALVSHVAAVADALAYAHGERVIHRDLKPHNVLCGDFGETVVIDWGLARRLDEKDSATLHQSLGAAPGETHVGAIMGTPSYMPPEQASGQRVDQQSDVYAIGAILYHLLAGNPPHVGPDLETLLDRVKNATPAKLPPEVPTDLVAIVERAIARDRATRYPSAAELASDLRRFMTGQLVLAHHYTPRQRLARFVSRNRGAVAVGGAALAIVGIVATVAIRNILVARREADVSRDVATASRDEARSRLVASYVDRAGLELVNGQPARSLAYTIASAQVAGLTPQTRLMAARALGQLAPVRWWKDSKVAFAMFVPNSHDLLLAMDEVVRWDPDTDRVRWRARGLRRGDLVHVGDALAFANDSTVKLLTVVDGAQLAEIKGTAGAKYTGLLGEDQSGRWLAATTDDRIDLFDSTTRTFVGSIPFAKAGRTPKVSADGQRVIVTSKPPVMSVLDRAGTVVATFEAQTGTVHYVGSELVYARPAGTNGIARVVVGDWSGAARLDLSIGISDVHALAVDDAGKRVALGTDDGLVQMRSLVSGEVLWQTDLGVQSENIAFDGDVLRVLSASVGMIAFDAASGVEIERVSIPGMYLAVSDDRARVAILSYGTGFAVWAPARGEIAPVAPSAARVSEIAFAADGAVISASDDGGIHELRDGRSVRQLASGVAINTLSRFEDGTLIAASTDGNIVVRDRDGGELRRFAGGIAATASPDGRMIATLTREGVVAIWDPATGSRVRELGMMGAGTRIRWSSDSRRISAMAVVGNVTVWNVDGTVVRSIPKGNFGAGSAVFSSDGKWLARPGEPTDTLFALDGGSDRKLLETPSSASLAVTFSPDDKTMLAAGVGFVSTWDVASGAPSLRIATKGWMTSAAFLDNGRYIVAGGVDRRVHVWSTDSGAELLVLTVPAQVRRIVVEKGDARIAVLTSRGAIVWTVPAFAGTLDELRTRTRCLLDVEVVDAHLRAHSIDMVACNRHVAFSSEP